MKISHTLLFCLIGMLTPAVSNAEILATYDFLESQPPANIQNTTDNQTSASVMGVAGVDASVYNTLTNQAATQNSGGIRTIENTPDPHAYARGSVTQNILPATFNGLTSADVVFHEFSVTAQQGEWQLDRLHFDYWVDNPETDTNYAATLYSDLVGGAQLDSHAPTIPDVVSSRNKEFSLAALSGVTLGQGQTATFRIAFTDNANSGSAIHRIDNVVLEGSSIVAIPEPAAAGVLMLIGTVLATRRRRS